MSLSSEVSSGALSVKKLTTSTRPTNPITHTARLLREKEGEGSSKERGDTHGKENRKYG